MNHTPGPWHLDGSSIWRLGEDGRPDVLLRAGDDLTTAQDAANLQLAVAAPEMKEALLELVGACANTGSRTRTCLTEGIGTCAHCQGRFALAKAGVEW